jgi:putative DNA primase/helicase
VSVYDAIPVELRERAQWVVWRLEQRDGKTTKVPYRADGAGKASSTKPDTWATFEAAVAAVDGFSASGIGFVFSPDDPYVGVDLDDGLSEADRGAIMVALDSYAETSVSGRGVHVIVRASLNSHGRNRQGPFEVYEDGRYFVVTGAHVRGTPTTIELRQTELEQVLERFLPATPPVPQHERETVPADLDDRALLDKAMGAKNGADFQDLYNGAWEGRYPSQSEADRSLAGRLAFWTGRDPERIDRLFRSSGLYRAKWDDPRGSSTYGAGTIAKAIAECQDVYDPHPRLRTPLSGDQPPAPSEESYDRSYDLSSAGRPTNGYLRSDLGNGEMFSDRNASRLRHVKERRLWLEWENGRWRPDTTGAAERAAKEVARERLRAAADIENDDERKKAVSWAMASQGDSRIRAMLSQATTEQALVLRADDLDVDPMLLACANGVIDLRTGELRPPDPSDLISLGSDVHYDPEADCPRWRRFLAEVFEDDDELISYLQRGLGYSTTGDTREHVLFVCHGIGRNGKGTLLETIKKIIGEFGKTAPFDTFTRTRGDRGTRNDLARLYRSRFVIASESGDGRRLDEAVVKSLTGGDTVAARFLYSEHFEFVPRFKIWLATNYRPRVDGDDEAIWARLRLIPFNVSFLGREDKTLAVTLEQELPGILAWTVQGALDWQRHGLGTASAVEKATADYRMDEDVLGAFLAERCVLEGEIEPAQLRESYEAFCADVGEKPLAANTLGKRLARRGIKRGGRSSSYQKLSLQ